MMEHAVHFWWKCSDVGRIILIVNYRIRGTCQEFPPDTKVNIQVQYCRLRHLYLTRITQLVICKTSSVVHAVQKPVSKLKNLLWKFFTPAAIGLDLWMGTRMTNKSVSASPKTLQFSRVRSTRILSSQCHAIIFKSVCVSSAQQWFWHRQAKRNLKNGEMVALKNGMHARVSTIRCLASTMKDESYVDVYRRYSYHLGVVF